MTDTTYMVENQQEYTTLFKNIYTLLRIKDEWKKKSQKWTWSFSFCGPHLTNNWP
jgi:hypothetical protein